jgi:hypothetical protein
VSDIFISYASADRDRARVLAQALTEHGFSVWWDRTIPPGRQFDEVIEEALDAARCVVVLWSTTSVASTWVKTEAAEAMRRKILVPVLIDGVKIPLEFRRLQAADLSLWKGESAHEELQKFFQSIEVNVGHGGASRAAPAPVAPAPPPHHAEVRPLPLAQPQPQPQAPPPQVARPQAPIPRPKTKAIGIAVGAFAAVVAIAVGYTAYNERVKRVAMEERVERERRAAEEARRAAEEAAARARAAQEEAAKEAARRKAEDQRRAAEDARRVAESAARAKAAQEEARARSAQEAARARAAQEEAARARAAQEEAARAARERADRLAEQERKQKTAARSTSMRISWYDHALRYSGVLTGSAGFGTLRATVWDLRTGAQIGNYEVPVTVTRQGASDFVVSGNFSIPKDSVTPHPHVHTPRLFLRTQPDGTLRFIQNCPRAGECYAAK